MTKTEIKQHHNNLDVCLKAFSEAAHKRLDQALTCGAFSGEEPYISHPGTSVVLPRMVVAIVADEAKASMQRLIELDKSSDLKADFENLKCFI